MVAAGLTTSAAPAQAVDTIRIEGPDRYATAVEADRAVEGTGGPVFLASGVKFPDALAAAPVVAAEGGHLLLTQPDRLPAIVAERIAEIGPSEIVVVGSEASVSAEVLEQAVAAAGGAAEVATTRLGGAGRVETSLLLLDRLRDLGPAVEHIWVASGSNFPDALVAASVAGLHGHAVVLDFHGRDQTSTQAWVDAVAPHLAGASVSIAGGEPSVSAATAAGLERAGVPSINRFAGRDRYETASMINQSWAEPQSDSMLLATGQNFPDALAGAALSAFSGAPLFLTPNACHPAITPLLQQRAAEIGATVVVGLGSASTVSDGALSLSRCETPLRQQIAQVYGSFPTQRYSGTGTTVIDLGRPIPYAQIVTTARSSSFILIHALNASKQALYTIGSGTFSYSGTGVLHPYPEGVSLRYLRIEATGAWTLEVRDLDSAPILSGAASGNGDGVYLYNGSAGTATISTAGSTYRRLSINQFYGYWWRSENHPDSTAGTSFTTPLQVGPSIVEVNALEPWQLQVR